MKVKKCNIDELIEKCLVGKADENEEKIVSEYVEESDQNMFHMLRVASSIRKMQMAESRQKGGRYYFGKKHVFNIAASVAILMITGETKMIIDDNNNAFCGYRSAENIQDSTTPSSGNNNSVYYANADEIPVSKKPVQARGTNTIVANEYGQDSLSEPQLIATKVEKTIRSNNYRNAGIVASVRHAGSHDYPLWDNKIHDKYSLIPVSERYFECTIPDQWTDEGVSIGWETNARTVHVGVLTKDDNLLCEYEFDASKNGAVISSDDISNINLLGGDEVKCVFTVEYGDDDSIVKTKMVKIFEKNAN
ncbi:MAG: hypothetical protein J6X86_03200 [Bacteroidales bacterium]|nr:hypothetical protein [Bacteroidales bacterium]